MGGYLDRVAAAYGAVILLLGRLALAAIFVPSGFGKLTRLDAFAHPHRGCRRSSAPALSSSAHFASFSG